MREGVLVEITPLCRIMANHGSDKWSGRHDYTIEYHSLFRNRRLGIRTVFELGIGSNSQDIPCNMGLRGTPSASLRGWRAYFPNAIIYGADIDREILINEDRIFTFYVDQRDKTSIEEMWNIEPLKSITFDLMVDDGLHSIEANLTFLRNSFRKLNLGGVYYIEDIRNSHKTIAEYIRGLEEIRETVDFKYEIINSILPGNVIDNCLIKLSDFKTK